MLFSANLLSSFLNTLYDVNYKLKGKIDQTYSKNLVV